MEVGYSARLEIAVPLKPRRLADSVDSTRCGSYLFFHRGPNVMPKSSCRSR